MRKIKNFLLFLFIAVAYSSSSQESAGIVTYRGVINKTYVDSFLTDLKQKDIPMNIKQGVVDMYTNATPEEYFLNFDGQESYYYFNPALEVEEGYNIGSLAGRNSYFTNNAAKTIIESSPSLGYIAYDPIDWKITNKTKTIGDFKCYQALATEKLIGRQGYYKRKVTAWFAPEIPLSFGPKHYTGLPGLILQIERPEFTLTVTKLDLNPEEKDIKIKRLNKNVRVITQEEAISRITEMEEDRKRSR